MPDDLALRLAVLADSRYRWRYPERRDGVEIRPHDYGPGKVCTLRGADCLGEACPGKWCERACE